MNEQTENRKKWIEYISSSEDPTRLERMAMAAMPAIIHEYFKGVEVLTNRDNLNHAYQLNPRGIDDLDAESFHAAADTAWCMAWAMCDRYWQVHKQSAEEGEQ
jgi:hypothetical protein